jgi:hypothetical protein
MNLVAATVMNGFVHVALQVVRQLDVNELLYCSHLGDALVSLLIHSLVPVSV